MPHSNSNVRFDLEHFFELLPDLMCIAGFDGYFKKINPAVSKTLGYTEAELLSKPICNFIYHEDQPMTARHRDLLLENIPLLNFENRYVAKSGEIVWLVWTSMPVQNQQLVFAVAKNITYRKKLEEYHRIAQIIGSHASEKEPDTVGNYKNLSAADQSWLDDLEKLIRKYTGKADVNIKTLSYDMAISERQLYRRIKTITGITPNKYIRIIRLQLAHEAIKTGKYRTVSEISHAAGFGTPAYFNKLFKEVYNLNVGELL
ncbi:MAG: helix-turn-helix domain-containing protein [Sphingobacteriaceae bacterium]|nr:MAG: helix-turn-helix domain-containing protein [Sphingobacteriaceae bacterium]